MAFPSTGAILADQLGAPDAAAYDLSAGLHRLHVRARAGVRDARRRARAAGARRRRRRALEDPRLERPLDVRRSSATAPARSCSSGSRDGGFLGFELGADGSGGPAALPPAGGSRAPATAETVAAGQHFVQMNGREVFKFATRVLVSSAEAVLAECGRTIDDVDVYVPHQANMRIIEHARQKLGIPDGEGGGERRPLREHVVGLDSARARRRRRPTEGSRRGKLVLMTGMGAGLTWGSGLIEWTTEERCSERRRSHSASRARARSRRAWAGRSPRPCPRRWTSTSAASEASGLDLERLCFEAPRGGARRRRRCSSRRSSRRAWRCSRRCARTAIEPDFVVGHSVGEFAALAAAQAHSTAEEAIALVRERGLAMAEAAREHPGSMAAILGLDDAVVEELCSRIAGVWPANYNCPGQIVVSGENPSVRGVLQPRRSARARGAR